MKKSTFEKNGGYFVNGVAYMDCKITGEPVANVSTGIKSDYDILYPVLCELDKEYQLYTMFYF